MSNVTTEQWDIPPQKNPNTGDIGGCANTRGRGGGSQYHPRAVHEKLVKFPSMVLVSTLEFPPTKWVTQFCRIYRDESLFSRST